MTPDRWFALAMIACAAIFDWCWYRRAKRELRRELLQREIKRMADEYDVRELIESAHE